MENISDEELIKRCLYGNPHGLERIEACNKLATRCYDILHPKTELSTKEYRQLRNEHEMLMREVINDVKFINEESLFEQKEQITSGEEFFPVISHPNLFDPHFDEERYIEVKKKEKFVACHLSLYGLEKQFWEQLEEGMFQTKDNARALRDIEGIIFDPNVRKREIPYLSKKKLKEGLEYVKENIDKILTKHGRLISRGDTWGMLLRIRDGEIQDINDIKPAGLIGFEQFLISWKYVKPDHRIEYVATRDRSMTICNKITNPKIEEGKYQVCSSATLSGDQSISIRKRKEIDWENVNQIKKDIEKITESVMEMSNKIQEAKKEWEKGLISYTKVSELDNALRDLYKGRDIMLKAYNKELKREWKTKSQLNCIHNFLGMVSYPDALKDKWLEVQLAYENGEISEDKATKLLKEIGQLEEAFKAELIEGKREGFTKPTEYQPVRMRLFGLQRAVNDLMNKTLRFYPLNKDIIPDGIIRHTIEKGFKGKERAQLVSNAILSDAEYKKIVDDFMNLSYEKFRDMLYPHAQKEAVEEELIFHWADTLDTFSAEDIKYYYQFLKISELLFGDNNIHWWRPLIMPHFNEGEPMPMSKFKEEAKLAIPLSQVEHEWKLSLDIEELYKRRDWLLNTFILVDEEKIIEKIRNFERGEPDLPTLWSWKGVQEYVVYIPSYDTALKIETLINSRLADLERLKQVYERDREELFQPEKFFDNIKRSVKSLIEIMNIMNYIFSEENLPNYFYIEEKLKQFGFKYQEFF